MRQLNEHDAVAVLNAILVGYEHLECLDKIQHTTLYKQSLKMKLNAVQQELEKSVEGLNEIYGTDDQALFNLMENKKQLMKKIAVLRPELKSGLNQVIDAYLEMPKLTLHRLGIKIIEKDEE